jgi:hypothetical protein
LRAEQKGKSCGKLFLVGSEHFEILERLVKKKLVIGPAIRPQGRGRGTNGSLTAPQT